MFTGDVRNEPVHTNRIQYNVQPANIAPDSLQPLLNPPLLLGLQNPIFNIAVRYHWYQLNRYLVSSILQRHYCQPL